MSVMRRLGEYRHISNTNIHKIKLKKKHHHSVFKSVSTGQHEQKRPGRKREGWGGGNVALIRDNWSENENREDLFVLCPC